MWKWKEVCYRNMQISSRTAEPQAGRLVPLVSPQLRAECWHQLKLLTCGQEGRAGLQQCCGAAGGRRGEQGEVKGTKGTGTPGQVRATTQLPQTFCSHFSLERNAGMCKEPHCFSSSHSSDLKIPRGFHHRPGSAFSRRMFLKKHLKADSG